jgi:hypothetical protein
VVLALEMNSVVRQLLAEAALQVLAYTLPPLGELYLLEIFSTQQFRVKTIKTFNSFLKSPFHEATGFINGRR